MADTSAPLKPSILAGLISLAFFCALVGLGTVLTEYRPPWALVVVLGLVVLGASTALSARRGRGS